MQVSIFYPQFVEPDTVAGVDVLNVKTLDRLVSISTAGADDQHAVSIIPLFNIIQRNLVAADNDLVTGDDLFYVHVVIHIFDDQDNDIAVDLAQP